MKCIKVDEDLFALHSDNSCSDEKYVFRDELKINHAEVITTFLPVNYMKHFFCLHFTWNEVIHIPVVILMQSIFHNVTVLNITFGLFILVK